MLLFFVFEEEDPIRFLGFCTGTFSVLRTLLPEISNFPVLLRFVFVNRFLFYRRIVVVRSVNGQ